MKKTLLAITLTATALLTACESDATIANRNISTAADNFEVNRRAIFFNGITDKYLMTIEGYCSIDTGDDKKITVTCKVGPDRYKRSYLGLSDNVSYYVEQLEAANVSAYHYRVILKPESIIPDLEIK